MKGQHMNVPMFVCSFGRTSSISAMERAHYRSKKSWLYTLLIPLQRSLLSMLWLRNSRFDQTHSSALGICGLIGHPEVCHEYSTPVHGKCIQWGRNAYPSNLREQHQSGFQLQPLFHLGKKHSLVRPQFLKERLTCRKVYTSNITLRQLSLGTIKPHKPHIYEAVTLLNSTLCPAFLLITLWFRRKTFWYVLVLITSTLHLRNANTPASLPPLV